MFFIVRSTIPPAQGQIGATLLWFKDTWVFTQEVGLGKHSHQDDTFLYSQFSFTWKNVTSHMWLSQVFICHSVMTLWEIQFC